MAVTRGGERPDLARIRPALLVGEYPRPEDVAWLASQHGVTAIANLQDHDDLSAKGLDVGALRNAARLSAVEFHHFPVPDYAPERLAQQLDAILAALTDLEARGHVIYLHCNAGMNRAPTVAIAYLYVTGGLSLRAACDLVKARRQCGPYMQLLEAHFAR